MSTKKYHKQEWERKKISKEINLPCFAFFRDDDIGYMNNKFKKMFDFFRSKNIYLNAAIIPSQLENIDFETLKILHTNLICSLQHGLAHKINYCSADNDVGEFHVSLSEKESEAKLEQGWSLFRKYINTDFKGFVPPWHIFPQIEIILRNKYDLISGYGNKVELIKNELLSVPVNIDTIKDYKLNSCYSYKEIIEKCKKQIRQTRFLGFLLHHNHMKIKDLVLIERIVEYLHKNKIPIVKLSDLIALVKK